MKKVVLKVKGMVCTGCENRVTNTLMNIKGVAKVKADYKKKLVTISLKEDIAENILEDAIQNLEYEIVKD